MSIAWNDLIITFFKADLNLKYIYPQFIDKQELYSSLYWYYISLSVVYIIVYEVILRGIWQNWLTNVFQGSYWVRAFKAIISVNIIGAVFYHSLFYDFYFMMLISGIFFGYIYAKYQNLYAVILSHVLYEIIMITNVGLVVF